MSRINAKECRRMTLEKKLQFDRLNREKNERACLRCSRKLQNSGENVSITFALISFVSTRSTIKLQVKITRI